MKKILFIVLAGVLIMPNLCESYASMEASVDKSYTGNLTDNKNVHQSDSVSMNYDAQKGVISITTIADMKDVEVRIYKNGALIYEDWDNVRRGTSLNYTMTDDERGEYDVRVGVEDGTDIEETIVKE